MSIGSSLNNFDQSQLEERTGEFVARVLHEHPRNNVGALDCCFKLVREDSVLDLIREFTKRERRR